MRLELYLVLALAVLAACRASLDPECPPVACQVTVPHFTVIDRRIVTADGMELLLRGVNARVNGIFDVSFNDGRAALEPIPEFGAEDAALMARWGMNLVRLPINWSALEPERDRFDDAYVGRIREVVDLCAEHGVYVLLDFHQDAYSKEIGEDGAPLWAIVPPPTELLEGPLHDLDERRTSKQTLDAFDSFFDNVDGLQDEFADAVAYVDAAFRVHPNVIGIEIFNEPIAGADNSKLIPFYLEVIDRAANPTRLWFFEPNVIRNQLDKMPLSPEPFARHNAVYSPHIYTDVFTLGARNFASNDPAILAPSMENAHKEAVAWDTPLFVGEFGIGPNEPNAVTWYTTQIDLQNRFLAHSAFWVWKEDSQGSWGMFDAVTDGVWAPREHVVKGITAPFPHEVEGTLVNLAFDRAAVRATATVELNARGDGRMVWGIPELWYPNGARVMCDAAPAAPAEVKAGRSSLACPVATQTVSISRR